MRKPACAPLCRTATVSLTLPLDCAFVCPARSDYDELLTGKRRESTYHVSSLRAVGRPRPRSLLAHPFASTTWVPPQSIGNLPSLFFSTAGKATPLVVLAAAGFQCVARKWQHACRVNAATM